MSDHCDREILMTGMGPMTCGAPVPRKSCLSEYGDAVGCPYVGAGSPPQVGVPKPRTPDQMACDALMVSLTNVTPAPDVVTAIEDVREQAKTLGMIIFAKVPPSRERSLAVTHLEETVMWAVKALVLSGVPR